MANQFGFCKISPQPEIGYLYFTAHNNQNKNTTLVTKNTLLNNNKLSITPFNWLCFNYVLKHRQDITYNPQ